MTELLHHVPDWIGLVLILGIGAGLVGLAVFGSLIGGLADSAINHDKTKK